MKGYQVALFLFFMKKFLIFIFLITILIMGEYYFINEVFAQRRLLVMGTSLFVIIVSVYTIFRFAKKRFIGIKQPKATN